MAFASASAPYSVLVVALVMLVAIVPTEAPGDDFSFFRVEVFDGLNIMSARDKLVAC